MIRTLSCHCGQVRLEVNAELGRPTECNGSTCGRHRYDGRTDMPGGDVPPLADSASGAVSSP